MLGTESKERYLKAFEQARPNGRAPGWFENLREEGISGFQALGFPTTRNEEWKYTNIEPVTSQSFIQVGGNAANADPGDLFTRSFVDKDSLYLTFINGVYAPKHSHVESLPNGIRVRSLAEAVCDDDPAVAADLGHYAEHRRHAFTALNTAFMIDGAAVEIASGCRLVEPIQLVFVSMAGSQPMVSHPRILIIGGAGSEARIVESYIGSESGNYFCNAVTELIGGADSLLEHYRLQQEGLAGFHVGTLAAKLARGCHLTAHSVSLSGALLRNNVHIVLDGEGAECVLNGLYIADGKQHVDNFTEIEHAKPHGTSLELYKGILSGNAHGVFNGKIVVHKDAQKTDARQTNKNLLLSPDAVVNTKPQLEIYADDVKCSHGSTIGQLDPDAMFYLRSRGLGVDEARSLLSFAFASDVVGKIKIDALRLRLDGYLAVKFRRDKIAIGAS
ncbi:MAG: Fe-S cluster assembly protein SufD [Candidatus Binatota bacterium]|nr:Fe-S cluster assembly protein SufD [Candidatus Binatota bacterium]